MSNQLIFIFFVYKMSQNWKMLIIFPEPKVMSLFCLFFPTSSLKPKDSFAIINVKEKWDI